jgi:hypothetical protein
MILSNAKAVSFQLIVVWEETNEGLRISRSNFELKPRRSGKGTHLHKVSLQKILFTS